MSSVRSPKAIPAATRLLEEFADLTSRIALVEEDRADSIALANSRADGAAQPMLDRLEDIRAALEPWWLASGQALAGGNKSVELGGCLIGLRLSRPKLAHGFESDDKATEALRSTRWAKQTTRVKYSLDRTATLKLMQLAGKAGQDVASLGFSIEQSNAFFIERAEQAATRTA
jgi:hypothetical protein